MKQYNGVFYFDGEEEDIAFRWMWTCLTDLSWRGKIETIWRIIIRKPPKRYFTDYDYWDDYKNWLKQLKAGDKHKDLTQQNL